MGVPYRPLSISKKYQCRVPHDTVGHSSTVLPMMICRTSPSCQGFVPRLSGLSVITVPTLEEEVSLKQNVCSVKPQPQPPVPPSKYPKKNRSNFYL